MVDQAIAEVTRNHFRYGLFIAVLTNVLYFTGRSNILFHYSRFKPVYIRHPVTYKYNVSKGYDYIGNNNQDFQMPLRLNIHGVYEYENLPKRLDTILKQRYLDKTIAVHVLSRSC